MGGLLLSFMAGVAGSGHCIGMCGGIIGAIAISSPKSRFQAFIATLFYHMGRISTYGLLGGIAGYFSETALLSNYINIFNYLFLFTNIFIIILGLSTAFGLKFSISSLDGAPFKFISKLLGKAAASSSIALFFLTGIVMGFLPCGLVYGILASAATTGSTSTGALLMLAFGIGTLPVLMLYGEIATSLKRGLSRFYMKIIGIAVASLGLYGVLDAAARLKIIAGGKLF